MHFTTLVCLKIISSKMSHPWPMLRIIDELKKILEEHKVCPSHGINHALAVMNHAQQALLHWPKLGEKEKFAVLLAALLHDADDDKFFPRHDHKELTNLRKICQDIDEKTLDLVERMVHLVSSSKNGDTIPAEIVAEQTEWMLIPRHADRLEAIGKIGVERCWKYSKTIGNPIYIPTSSAISSSSSVAPGFATALPRDEKELWAKVATEERYQAYRGKSVSMLDHFYDKLLRLTFFPVMPAGNLYWEKVCGERRAVLVKFVLDCCSRILQTGLLTSEDVDQIILMIK